MELPEHRMWGPGNEVPESSGCLSGGSFSNSRLDLACESQKQPQEPHTGLDSENPLAKAVGCPSFHC